ncbi:hypothetical protein SKAU_G00367140 [Synaphobranchus kaupii]|uniref:Uncharacterized protein n=1 Tax=Synaphobranchus kaupii TaxID=118154 RepID=A0A9Q1EF97_SYNKA|nr:hypothetical protein SKAU_G00367140 [Synaphobranchus kaupii]
MHSSLFNDERETSPTLPLLLLGALSPELLFDALLFVFLGSASATFVLKWGATAISKIIVSGRTYSIYQPSSCVEAVMSSSSSRLRQSPCRKKHYPSSTYHTAV